VGGLAPDRFRLTFNQFFLIACALVVGSACRSVSVEFNVLSAASTPVPTAASATPVQQGASLANDSKPTVDPTVPAPGSVSSGLSFAPRGVNDTASGTIASQGQHDSFPFQGTQGQLLELRVKRTSGVTLFPRVELLDPSGASESPFSGSSGPDALLEYKLASTGAYTIEVRAFQGLGPYSVSWSLDRFGQLVNGGQVSAELANPSQHDRYRFEASQGQLLTAQVQRTSGVSLVPWLDLLDPTGATEQSADGYGAAQVKLETKLASSGTYMLVVGGKNTGPYMVTLSIR
jgi:hypothetical protein